MTVIQLTSLVAVQLQPAPAVTFTALVAPLAGADSCVLLMLYVHDGGRTAAACWVTVYACPAIVTTPVRVAPVFAATVRFTVPLPLPLAPPVTVIHSDLRCRRPATPACGCHANGARCPGSQAPSTASH